MPALRVVFPALLLTMMSAAPPATAQAPMHLTRLRGAVRLDGRVDEPAWHDITPLPLVQFEPTPGGPMSERTEIRIAYDDRYLYASGRFADAEPSAIRANSMVRDHYAEDDFLNLVIDTFDDRETAVWFVVTPNGTRQDGAISNDADGASAVWNHPEYDMLWDAVSVVDRDGWSVEVRIPLSTLRFEAHDGQVTMGLIAARVISRRKERHIFPAIRPVASSAQFKPSLAARVALDGVDVPRLAQLTPYALVGSERSAPSADVGDRGVREIGADLKYGLSSRLTLDLSVNTDFAQTEVDDARVNLTRFSLFFPEKRRFFLERSGTFDVRTGGDDRLFYSRRIGLGPDGLPRRITAGGRLVGRAGQWDVGVLDMQMRDDRGLPSENAAVVRVRRNVVNAYSYVGAIATFAGGDGRRARTAQGVDGTLRVAGDDYLVWSVAASQDSATETPDADASVARLAWERRRRSGLAATTALTRIGPRYDPALGFVQRRNMLALDQRTAYGWFPAHGPARETSVAVATSAIRRATADSLETFSVEPSWQVLFRRSGDARLFVRTRREVVSDTFALARDAVVAPGRYTFVEGGASLSSPPGALARVHVELEGGRFFDGRRLSVLVSPSWNPSPHVELAADVESNRVRFASRRQTFDGDVLRLRSRVSLNARASLTGGVQYNRAAGEMRSSLRFRYNVSEGTDLFVVLDDAREEPAQTVFGLPASRGPRYVAVKYAHTLR
jgi:uncharacterized protein DUF5916